MRAGFFPGYVGVPATWSDDRQFAADPELERDLDFLRVPERDRAGLRALAEATRAHAVRWHARVRELPGFAGHGEPQSRLAERAVTIAYVTDLHGARTLLHAQEWWQDFQARPPRAPARAVLAFWHWLRRGGAPHPADAWLARHGLTADRRVRALLRRAWRAGGVARRTIAAWQALPAGTAPHDAGLALLHEVWRAPGAVTRELSALRAVQSLSVLDVRNYRELVFRVGDYAADGEDPALATALP
jgi:hypothetical protein